IVAVSGEPGDLGRRTVEKCPLPEVVVLGNDRVPFCASDFPYSAIARSAEAEQLDMGRARELVPESWRQLRAQIFVEKELHAVSEHARLRSRAAAKARAARTSSFSRLGKSARISASVIPPARYSRMS